MNSADGKLKAAILGTTGYVGGELLRLLTGHPQVDEVRGYSSSSVGRPWSAVHPSLLNLPEAPVFEPFDPEAAGRWADVVFLALPHGESQKILADVEAAGARLVIDCAADFRLANRELAERTYGPHQAPEFLGSFACGLADVAGVALSGAERIAVPGCFATAALLSLWPLAPVLGGDSQPVCWAATGSSGSGAKPKANTHHPFRANNFFAYGLGGHRHEAELRERLIEWCGDGAPSASLLTHSAPIVRGIHATLHLRPRRLIEDPNPLFRTTYDGHPFVHVLDHPPQLTAVVGTNHAHLHAVARDGGREILVVTVIDNLVKGAAGQAVQAMNLSLGVSEIAGLELAGMAPC